MDYEQLTACMVHRLETFFNVEVVVPNGLTAEEKYAYVMTIAENWAHGASVEELAAGEAALEACEEEIAAMAAEEAEEEESNNNS